MIRKFDTWVGKKIAFPIIVFVCQHANTNQRNVSSYCFMAAWMMILSAVDYVQWIDYFTAVFSLFAIISCMLEIAFFNELPEWNKNKSEYNTRARLVMWIWLVFMCSISLVFWFLWNWRAYCVVICFLLGFYADDIKTIPPKKIKEKKVVSLAPAG